MKKLDFVMICQYNDIELKLLYMKKVMFTAAIAALIFGFASCTEQSRVKTFGGSMTVELEPGEKLMMATWKNDNLFYLTEPMEEGYQPKTKTFRESSAFGVMESKITFVESR